MTALYCGKLPYLITDPNYDDHKCTGGDGCCGNNDHWCGPNEGDCDSDSDCWGSMRCGSNNCPKGGGFTKDDDCCYGKNKYLFTVTGVKKMRWFLSLSRCHFQPKVTKGHEWLEMALETFLKGLTKYEGWYLPHKT